MQLKIIKVDIQVFKRYQNQVLDIYLEAGTNPPMEQYMNGEKEKDYMLTFFPIGGYGYFALDKNKLIGFILAHPSKHDSFLPESLKNKFPVEKCFYIAEMDIHQEFRGKDIGSKLMTTLIEKIDKKWDYLFIRAWKKNIKAIKFYKKLGFKLSETIPQKKIKKDRTGTFMIKKQYLFQKLD